MRIDLVQAFASVLPSGRKAPVYWKFFARALKKTSAALRNLSHSSPSSEPPARPAFFQRSIRPLNLREVSSHAVEFLSPSASATIAS